MTEFQPLSMLLTGGAGFIGSNLVHYLRAQVPGARLVNLDLLTYAGSQDNLRGLDDEGYTFVQGDICDAGLVGRVIREHNVDTVLHLAAESHVDRSITGPGVFIQTNLVGTYTLLEQARQFWLDEKGLDASRCRFLHVSTDEVYGTLGKDDPAFTERTPYAPNSPYSASKAGSDHLARAYHHTYGLPVVVSNCSNNYGPNQHGEKFIPTVIRACVTGQPIPVYGDGSNIRDWLYVEDHCRALWRVACRGRPGECYNIGGLNEWANVDIARTICRLMDARRPDGAPHENLIGFVTDRPGHDWRYAIDNARIATELDWTPEETFETGIEKTVDWYLETGRWALK